MIVDGKKLAEEIKNSLCGEVLKLDKKPRLAIVRVGSNMVTEKFLEQKIKFAQAIGISTRVHGFKESISTTELRKEISKIIHTKENTGVVIQLPLPKSINTQYILDTIPPEKDPDVLSSKGFGLFATRRSKILPPVAGAVKFILNRNGIEVKGKNSTIVGSGKLVGKPVMIWFVNEGATVTVVNEFSMGHKLWTTNSDIIISGVGKPGIITSDMVKDGVIAIDCGTSEAEGRLAGDFDPSVAQKASIFTPVPGGVGPITVAMLFSNLVELAKTR